MFVSNKDHQEDFFKKWESILSSKKLERLKKTVGYIFYELIFCKVREEDFAILYSSHPLSAPNAPVNCLVCAIFLLHKYNWSVDELMGQMDFNIEIQVALGIKDIEYRPFCRRTLFNFKRRILAHYQKSGENLLERIFDYLTAEQIETLSIKTNIQRADTVLINTNIGEYSRVSLLVEVLNRVYGILDQTDQRLYEFLFEDYRQGGEKYVYHMTGGTKQEKLEKLSKVYYRVRNLLGDKYSTSSVFELFERVYTEHFKEVKVKDKQVSIVVRSSEELGSDIVQSPDDLDATYRKKQKEAYKGYTLFGVESCHPENEIDLVTKIVVATNNTDDATILEENLKPMAEATPQLEELHLDGGFGSQRVDEIAAEKEIIIIQTAVKGRTAVAPIKVWQNEEGQIEAQCSNENHPPVEAKSTGKNYKAEFDLKGHCEGCPFYDQCATKNERNPDGYRENHYLCCYHRAIRFFYPPLPPPSSVGLATALPCLKQGTSGAYQFSLNIQSLNI